MQHERLSLTNGARILRGFRRVGIALATLVVVIGSAASVGIAYDSATGEISKYEQAKCLLSKPSGKLVSESLYGDDTLYKFGKNGCPGYHYSIEMVDLFDYMDAEKPSFFISASKVLSLGLAWTIAGASVALVFLWGLGWVVAGFTRD